MPLRGDQRALLQLLCERGQSYADISDLLGKGPDEVRADARAALTEIGGGDPDAEVGLTDFLLGQADPIGRADATRYLQANPAALELAKRIEAGLQLIAPEASLPKLPEPRGKRARAALPAAGEEQPADAATATTTQRDSAPQGRLIAIIAVLGALLIVAILAISGVFSGDDGSTGASGATTATSTDPSEQTRNVTTVDLKPSNGSGVAGSARFGIANGSQLYVELSLEGLTQPADGDALLLWLMVGDKAGYPLNNPAQTPITPDANGSFSGTIAVPSAIALTVGNQATAVKVSSSSVRAIAAAAKDAAKQEAPILGFIGDELAAGKIPLVRSEG